jgi:hypothetical protein
MRVRREKTMRMIGVVGAVLLAGIALPAAASDGEGPQPGRALTHPVASCDAPVANPNARRHVRHVVRQVRRVRRQTVVMLPPPPPLSVYNPWLPSPYNSDYDRTMVQHFQAPPVSGIYGIESGLPPTPPVIPFRPYRVQANGAVLQYDGITGEYIPLAALDAYRVVAAATPVPVLIEDR